MADGADGAKPPEMIVTPVTVMTAGARRRERARALIPGEGMRKSLISVSDSPTRSGEKGAGCEGTIEYRNWRSGLDTEESSGMFELDMTRYRADYLLGR